MKKYILSPLCSAFIVPGLGQVLNGNLKKGLILLSIVFFLFTGAVLRLALLIYATVTGSEGMTYHSGEMMEELPGQVFSSILPFIIGFAMVWIYSVIDALWTGKKLENQ